MACSIQLVRLNDFAADIDSIDLSANGYSLDRDGYFPVVAPIGAKSVHEVITLKLQGTSKDDLAAMTQEIDEKIKQVQWWIDDPGVERYQVWLRVQQENESLPRQAQLLNITPPDKLRVFVPEEIIDNYIGSYSLGIERTPYWEDPYPYPTTTDKTSINSIGGMAVLSETINGDVPARLAKLNFVGVNLFTNYWLGWRTSRFGTTANFVPVWSLKDGTGGTDTNTAADGSAYSGTKMTCTFGSDATLIERCYISVVDVTANAADQRGNFTVILRAKMSDTSIARVRMRAGWLNLEDATISSPVYRSRVVINGNNGAISDPWTYYEIGVISLPPLRYYNPSLALDYYTIALDAERLSGTGNLQMDCLILIPNDEGMIRLTSSADLSSATAITLTSVTTPHDQNYGYMSSVVFGNTAYDIVTVSPINWGLPANNEAPRLIAAGAGLNNLSAKATVFNLSYTYIPRWRTLRGNVT